MMKAKKKLDLHVRWAITRDMPELLRIESFCDKPLAEEEIKTILRRRECIGMVAEEKDAVLGIMIYELHKNYFNLIRLAVLATHWRRGVGTELVTKLISKLGQRRKQLICDVPEDMVDFQIFLRSCGLKCERIIADDTYRFVYRYCGDEWDSGGSD